MNKSSFLIAGKHAVYEALKNPKRKVLRVFLTEESKKNIHRENKKKNLLQDIKVHFKIRSLGFSDLYFVNVDLNSKFLKSSSNKETLLLGRPSHQK